MRDDCNSGLAFGGSTIRKLEYYIVPDAMASNADTLVTTGGVQSNHTRQVAAVAAKLGMKRHLVQKSRGSFQDAVYDRAGNVLMSRMMGAEIEFVDEGFDIGIHEAGGVRWPPGRAPWATDSCMQLGPTSWPPLVMAPSARR